MKRKTEYREIQKRLLLQQQEQKAARDVHREEDPQGQHLTEVLHIRRQTHAAAAAAAAAVAAAAVAAAAAAADASTRLRVEREDRAFCCPSGCSVLQQQQGKRRGDTGRRKGS